MDRRGPRVRIFFPATVVDGTVVLTHGGRLKDEFDNGERELLELSDVRLGDGAAGVGTGAGGGTDEANALVSLNRMLCVGLVDSPVARPADASIWGTRIRYSVTLRCDRVEVSGATHVPIATPVGSWLLSRDRRFLALTEAVVTVRGGEPQPFDVAFVNRSTADAVWWPRD